MYDSKTDASRINGTHRMGHAFRLDCREMGVGSRVEYGTPKVVKFALNSDNLVDEILNGIDDYEASKCEEAERVEFDREWIRVTTEIAFLNNEIREAAAWGRMTDPGYCCPDCDNWGLVRALDMARDELEALMDAGRVPFRDCF